MRPSNSPKRKRLLISTGMGSAEIFERKFYLRIPYSFVTMWLP